MTIIPSYATPLSLNDAARRIFAHSLQTSSIPAAWDRHLHFENQDLVLRPSTKEEFHTIPLDRYERIHAIALGKAALPMLETLLERTPGTLPISGICCAPSLPERRDSRIEYYAGGHPSPNQDSFHSAQAALRLLHHAGRNAFVFFLISGGGSAMFELPLDEKISLEDTVAFHRALVGSGASITEINTVRKHFSAVKGGRLAIAAPDAAKLTLLISDVPAGHLDALSSGPTLPDSSSPEDCREILHRYRLLDQFPPSVQAFFLQSGLLETPGEKRGRPSEPRADSETIQTIHPSDGKACLESTAVEDPGDERFAGFAHSRVEVLLSNQDLLHAAREYAEAQGWKVVIDNACDDWDYREAARYLLTRLNELRREHSRVCLLSGGEVTVRLSDKPGIGGRNQQFALACALKLAAIPPAGNMEPSIAVLSAGSDGVDGNSPAAGAIVDPATVARAQALSFDPEAALRDFDSFPLFTALGDTVVTGPTKNNLRDLRILLSE